MEHSAEIPAEVERKHIHCSPLIHQVCHPIIVVYQISQACSSFSVDLAGLIKKEINDF